MSNGSTMTGLHSAKSEGVPQMDTEAAARLLAELNTATEKHNGVEAAVQAVVEAGGYGTVLAAANAGDVTATTPPLHRAAWLGTRHVLECLLPVVGEGCRAVLDHKADARGGCTALMLACQEGHVEVVHMLIQRGCGCGPSLRNNQGRTAWDCAVDEQREEVVRLLQELAEGNTDLAEEKRKQETRMKDNRSVGQRQQGYEVPFEWLTGWGSGYTGDRFLNWTELREGMQGFVYRIERVQPRIGVGTG